MTRNIVALEKTLWKSWRARYGVGPLSPYERRALNSYSRKVVPVAEAEIIQKIRASRAIVFGDDRNVPEDQEILRLLLDRARMKRKEWLFLTDRAKPWPTLEMKSERLSASGGIDQRDRRVVERVRKWLERGKKVFIWTGALRVAPSMLPKRFGQVGLKNLFISTQAGPTRWFNRRFQGWGKIDSSLYLFLGRSPLLALEYFRAHHEGKGNLISSDKLQNEFQSYVTEICRRTGQKMPTAPRKILAPWEIDSLHWFLRANLPKETGAFLRERMLRGESAVLPDERIVLLTTLDRGHVAEEAGHYARLAGRLPTMGEMTIVLEEAFGFLASRWIDPDRKVPTAGIGEISAWSELHRMGYELGASLAERWKKSASSRKKIRELWRVLPRSEVEAAVILRALRDA